MKTQKRWIASVTKEAAKNTVSMPWERGASREAMIARREGRAAPERRSA